MDIRKIDELTKLVSDFDVDEIRKAYRVLKNRHDTVIRSQSLQMEKGMRVRFSHKGKKFEGEITKVNRKTVRVQTDNSMWNVSPTLLTVI